MTADRGQRLAILFPSREIGGAERYVATIALAAAARGWRVRLCFPASAATEAFRLDLGRRGVESRVLAIGMPHASGWSSALRAAAREAARSWRALASFRASTVMVMLPHPDASAGGAFGAALFPARCAVVTQLVPEPFTVTGSRRVLYRLARATGQRWVAVSEDNRRRLAAALGWPAARVRLIHNGVEHPAPVPQDRRLEACREARDAVRLPADAFVLLTVARLSSQKGLDVLAAAIPRVAAANPHALWVWAGDGDRREELLAALTASGVRDRVVLLGDRPDVARLLLTADVFVLPSRSEGLPFALLEAMAAEVPVIASDLEVIREVVDDGVHGRLVPAEDAAALADAMGAAIADPRAGRAMASAAAARVRERYRRQEMVDRTIALLEPWRSRRS